MVLNEIRETYRVGCCYVTPSITMSGVTRLLFDSVPLQFSELIPEVGYRV